MTRDDAALAISILALDMRQAVQKTATREEFMKLIQRLDNIGHGLTEKR